MSNRIADIRKFIRLLRDDWLVGCLTVAVLFGGLVGIGIPPLVVVGAIVATPILVILVIILGLADVRKDRAR